MSMQLDKLAGRISDADFHAKADLETRLALQRHLLSKLGSPWAPALPTPR